MHTHAAVGHQGAGRETNTVVAMMEGQVVKLASIRKCATSFDQYFKLQCAYYCEYSFAIVKELMSIIILV